MATNEQIRRAIGANNEAARRSIGSGNEAARRNIGRSNIAERTGLVDDLNRLVNSGAATKTLRTIEPRGARPASVGVSTYTPPATGNGGGIAGPLNESTTKAREYYDPVLLPTTDGLAWVKWKGVKKITMVDGNNAEVPMGFVNALSE